MVIKKTKFVRDFFISVSGGMLGGLIVARVLQGDEIIPWDQWITILLFILLVATVAYKHYYPTKQND